MLDALYPPKAFVYTNVLFARDKQHHVSINFVKSLHHWKLFQMVFVGEEREANGNRGIQLVAILKIIIKAFKIEMTITIIKDQKQKSQHEKALSVNF